MMKSLKEVQNLIKQILSSELNIASESILNDQSFHSLGLDSVNSIFLLNKMEDLLGVDIDPLSVYDNPTVLSFSEYLHTLQK